MNIFLHHELLIVCHVKLIKHDYNCSNHRFCTKEFGGGEGY